MCIKSRGFSSKDFVGQILKLLYIEFFIFCCIESIPEASLEGFLKKLFLAKLAYRK